MDKRDKNGIVLKSGQLYRYLVTKEQFDSFMSDPDYSVRYKNPWKILYQENKKAFSRVLPFFPTENNVFLFLDRIQIKRDEHHVGGWENKPVWEYRFLFETIVVTSDFVPEEDSEKFELLFEQLDK
jgi:hypothetical protein